LFDSSGALNTMACPTHQQAMPPAYRECAMNIARWFPEVLLTLGAPDLEEKSRPASAQIIDWPEGRTVEVVLEQRPAVAAAAAPPLAPARSHSLASVLGSLDSLAGDFENLAARFAPTATASVHVPAASLQWSAPCPIAAMAPPPLRQVQPHAQADVCQRLEAVAEDIAWLSARLQSAARTEAAGGYAPASAVNHTTAGAPEAERTVQAGVSDPPHPSNQPVSPAYRSKQLSKERNTKEPTPRTPGSSTRKAQAHQGGAVGHAAGRSRNGQAKANSWRNQRDSLTISINKVAQLGGEPSSPKFVKEAKVWGNSQARRLDKFADRSADAVRERIEKKLTRMFGDSSNARSQFPSV